MRDIPRRKECMQDYLCFGICYHVEVQWISAIEQKRFEKGHDGARGVVARAYYSYMKHLAFWHTEFLEINEQMLLRWIHG